MGYKDAKKAGAEHIGYGNYNHIQYSIDSTPASLISFAFSCHLAFEVAIYKVLPRASSFQFTRVL